MIKLFPFSHKEICFSIFIDLTCNFIPLKFTISAEIFCNFTHQYSRFGTEVYGLLQLNSGLNIRVLRPRMFSIVYPRVWYPDVFIGNSRPQQPRATRFSIRFSKIILLPGTCKQKGHSSCQTHVPGFGMLCIEYIALLFRWIVIAVYTYAYDVTYK